MWYHITLEQVKQRETIIKNDEKDHFLTIRDKQTKRFWKKELLELFADGYEYFSQLRTGGDHFKESFDERVVLPLKEKTKTEFFKKATYSNLMSIYGKFVHLRKHHGEDFLTVLTKISPSIEQNVITLKANEKQAITDSLWDDDPNSSKEFKAWQERTQAKINDLYYRIEAYEDARRGLENPAESFLAEIKACKLDIQRLEQLAFKSKSSSEHKQKKPDNKQQKANKNREKADSTPLSEEAEEKRRQDLEDLYAKDPDEPRWNR